MVAEAAGCSVIDGDEEELDRAGEEEEEDSSVEGDKTGPGLCKEESEPRAQSFCKRAACC